MIVKNPYNITLKSTKRNILTILITVALMIIGFILMMNDGFGFKTDLAFRRDNFTDGFQFESFLYTMNFILAIIASVAAVLMIAIRRDLLGIVCGLILFAFVLFVLPVGYKHTTGGIAGVSEKESLTLPKILIENIKD